METMTDSNNFVVEIIEHDITESPHIPSLLANVVSLDEIEYVSAIRSVPYTGDERFEEPYIRRKISSFMLHKPA